MTKPPPGYYFPKDDLLNSLRQNEVAWREKPQNRFTQSGFRQLSKLMPQKTCDVIRKQALSLAQDTNGFLGGNAYLLNRKLLSSPYFQVYDTQTWQIFNFQDLSKEAADWFQSGEIETMFEPHLGYRPTLQTLSVQVNEPGNTNRQPLHVDGYTDTAFKLFVYLTPCLTAVDGPFCIVPGSHRDPDRLHNGHEANRASLNQRCQMELEYDYNEAELLTGDIGDGFMSIQSAVHGGWPDHTTHPRVAIVCYLTGDRSWTGPFLHSAPKA